MPTITVIDFLLDDDNEEKFWHHGLTAGDVRSILDGAFTIRRNRNQRRASHILVGRDRQGRCIAVPIEPTYSTTLWRPVTAWLCKPDEHSWLTHL